MEDSDPPTNTDDDNNKPTANDTTKDSECENDEEKMIIQKNQDKIDDTNSTQQETPSKEQIDKKSDKTKG